MPFRVFCLTQLRYWVVRMTYGRWYVVLHVYRYEAWRFTCALIWL